MRKNSLFLIVVALYFSFLSTLHCQQMPRDIMQAYQSDDITRAIELADRSVELSQKGTDQEGLWNSFMIRAFLKNTTGDFYGAIEDSEQALELAAKLSTGHPGSRRVRFFEGRSLCWLGWAYKNLGRYDAAEKFFKRAVELGKDGERILIPAVWGFGYQEIGIIALRRGNLKEARAILEETTNYASSHQIHVGVAEGGAALAQIALLQGRYSEAEALANQSVEAAITCGCSTYNQLIARLILAEASYAQRASRPGQQILDLITQVEDDARSAGVQPVLARAMIMHSQLLPAKEFSKKSELLHEASDILRRIDSEYQAQGAQALGKHYLDTSYDSKARRYLERGLKISASMLQDIDHSMIRSDLAALEVLTGDTKSALVKLNGSLEVARQGNLLVEQLRLHQQIALIYEQENLTNLAVDHYQAALEVLASLLTVDASAETKQSYLQQQEELLLRASLIQRHPGVLTVRTELSGL